MNTRVKRRATPRERILDVLHAALNKRGYVGELIVKSGVERAFVIANIEVLARQGFVIFDGPARFDGTMVTFLSTPNTAFMNSAGDIRPLKELQNEIILAAIGRYGSRTLAAEKLQIPRSTLYRKLAKTKHR